MASDKPKIQLRMVETHDNLIEKKKGKRGRPRKNPVKLSVSTEEPKKRGRKKKLEQPVTANTEPQTTLVEVFASKLILCS